MLLLAAGCRIFQFVFNYGARVLNWRKAIPVEGAGSIQKIPALLKQLRVTKPLVVTDPGLMSAGVAQKVLSVLGSAGVNYTLCDEVGPNPTVNMVNAIQDLYLTQGCDGFIAIGGGSPIDAAKGAAARVKFPKKTVNQLGGLLRVWKKIPPFIAVPTTAGTGSETTIAALITDSETHHKYAIMDLHLIPLYAILDPELTVGLPRHITAMTGMDALTHAVEAYLCWTYGTKESIQFALDAVKYIFENLEKVYHDGSDIAARQAMLVASYKAGFAFTRAGVGNVHAIAHTLGGLYNTAHGLANAVILPVVLRDYGKAAHKKLARLSDIAGLAPETASAEAKADAFIDAVFAMNKRMGIPAGFDFIKETDIPQMIAWASKEANPLYPVPVVYDAPRYRRIIESLALPAHDGEDETVGKRNGRRAYRITSACIGCTACAKVCPVFAITGERGAVHAVNPKRCVSCGVCGSICPSGAVSDPSGIQRVRQQRSERRKPRIDTGLCSACGICVTDCTAGALSISEPAFKGDIAACAELSAPQKCIACSLCEKHCPLGAIRMEIPA
ncbi:MAG: hypothetical protein Pg6C_16190 [Treponemataceae bacterium]|nr:MAG: hypothetical protein Pg6C_16190 [Treponemataceae bacterium]